MKDTVDGILTGSCTPPKLGNDYSYEKELAEISEIYKDLPPKIYFDDKHKVYVCPLLIDAYSMDLEWLCHEMIGEYLSYDYVNPSAQIDLDLHTHSQMELFMEALCNPHGVHIPAEYENGYSQQVLNHVRGLIQRGKVEDFEYEQVDWLDIKGDLTFHYSVDGEVKCANRISQVYFVAFNQSCNFLVSDEHHHEYSQDELAYLDRLNKLSRKHNCNQ